MLLWCQSGRIFGRLRIFFQSSLHFTISYATVDRKGDEAPHRGAHQKYIVEKFTYRHALSQGEKGEECKTNGIVRPLYSAQNITTLRTRSVSWRATATSGFDHGVDMAGVADICE
ncbi:hypothetical protein CPB86DRAFT_128155 [Serendipita vermifera]|nr:hypothetical protein CPB86DRAFT_128155 [Serendipita vermifera]